MPALTLVEKPSPPPLRQKIAEIVSKIMDAGVGAGMCDNYVSDAEFSIAVDMIEELVIEEKHRV
jgi:hypothetical protein